MKNVQFVVVAIGVVLALAGCAPELVVKDLKVCWDAQNKTAKAEIANIGTRDAGAFMVDFNGDENPVSPNYRPQVRHTVPSLARGASVTLSADFKPLARAENNRLSNVYQITVLVDPKNTVKELNENNNAKTGALTPCE